MDHNVLARVLGQTQARHRAGHRRRHGHRHGAGQCGQHGGGLGRQEQGRDSADRRREQRGPDRPAHGCRRRREAGHQGLHHRHGQARPGAGAGHRTCSAASRSSCRRARWTRRPCRASPTRRAGATTGPKTPTGCARSTTRSTPWRRARSRFRPLPAITNWPAWCWRRACCCCWASCSCARPLFRTHSLTGSVTRRQVMTLHNRSTIAIASLLPLTRPVSGLGAPAGARPRCAGWATRP